MATRRAKAKKKERISAKQRADTHRSGFESASLNIPKDLNVIKIKKDTTVRWSVVPFEATEKNPLAYKFGRVGDLYFERTYYIHPQIGPDNLAYACPSRNTKHLPPDQRLKCPICEYRSKLARDPDADEDLMKSLLTKERQLWLIFDHDEPEKGVQLFDMSYHGLGKDLDEAIRTADEDDEYEFFADPEDGLILRMTFKEKAAGGGRSWYPVSRIDFKPRKKALSEEVLEHGIAIDDIPKVLPYDELKALFLQESTNEDSDDDDDDDEVEEKPKTRRRTASKKKPEPEEDEDDDDLDDLEDDDSDEDDEDFDDDLEDDDEDEEPEPPKKKTRGKASTKKTSPKTKTSPSKKKAEPEEDDDDLEDDDEDDDFDSAFDEDDDDDPDFDDDEDEDDEPEPPPKKRRTRSKK